MYELLTGLHPFRDLEDYSDGLGVPARMPPSLTEYRRDLPRDLEQLIMLCLELDPDTRIQSATELQLRFPKPMLEPDLVELAKLRTQDFEQTQIAGTNFWKKPEHTDAQSQESSSPAPVDESLRSAAPIDLSEPGEIARLRVDQDGPRLVYSRADNGPTTTFVVTLKKEITTVGRSTENDISLDDALASRYHFRIVATESGYQLEDMNSTNGTLVNGQKVDGIELGAGDRIQIGDCVLVYHA